MSMRTLLVILPSFPRWAQDSLSLPDAVRLPLGAVLAAEDLEAAEQPVRSAEADLKRAEAVHPAGISTDVDVSSIRAHLTATTGRVIARVRTAA